MKTAALVILMLMHASALHGAQQPNLINRLVSTVYDAALMRNQIAFTDAESGETVKYLLPVGFRPGFLVAMDRKGDVWLDDFDTWTLRKFSGSNGSLLASVAFPRRATYLVTDQNGSLIVGSANSQTGALAALYVERFTSDGAYVAGVDLGTLFAPGLISPVRQYGQTVPSGFSQGIPRILITRSGDLWVSATWSAYNPVIRLTPELKLRASYGIYAPLAMVPDDSDGVWICHNTGPLASQYILFGPPLPGMTFAGWVHLSGTGQLLDANGDGLALGNSITPSLGQRRYDGRQFQYPIPGAGFGAGHVRVHKPSNPPMPMFPWDDRIPMPNGNADYPLMPGFHLDGAQRLWIMRNSLAGGGAPYWAIMQWARAPLQEPYTNFLQVVLGEAIRIYVPYPPSYYWSSYWGNASLFEYVHYTDPYGDLDGDGVANHVELANFSNPLLPFGFSPAPSATFTGGAPGAMLSVTYEVPTDSGLAYWAPFALAQPAPYALGGGHFLPVPFSDPLLQLSLQVNVSGITGTQGTLDPQAQTTATLQIPPMPALSGFSLTSFIATHDPNLPLLLKTVSRPFTFTIP